jgi:hypothetical protein
VATDPDTEAEHWLDLGADPDLAGDRKPPRPWRWWYALVAGTVVAAVLLTRSQHTTQPPSASVGSGASGSPGAVRPLPGVHPPSPGPGPADRTGSGLATVSTGFEPTLGNADSVAVSSLGHPLLDVPAGWDLFGQGHGMVIRIELRRGRLTRTAVPEVGSASPVSFVVGTDRAIVQPRALVAGYVVHDGEPAARPASRCPSPPMRRCRLPTRPATS